MENSALLKAIIENAIDGIITIDNKGTIETINPSGCRLFEYHQSEVIGQNISMLMPPPDRDQHDNYLLNYHQTSKKTIIGIGREVLGLRKSGAIFPFRLGISEVQFRDAKSIQGSFMI